MIITRATNAWIKFIPLMTCGKRIFEVFSSTNEIQGKCWGVKDIKVICLLQYSYIT